MQGKGEPLPLQPIPKTKNNNKTKTNNKIKVVYTEDWTHPCSWVGMIFSLRLSLRNKQSSFNAAVGSSRILGADRKSVV